MKLRAITRPLISLLPIVLLGLSLSACGIGESLTAKTFTFKGELPADFSLKAQAHYSVANKCVNGRSKAKSFTTEFQSTPQQYNFDIPVTYRNGLCEMKLARVGLFIKGRHGDKDWQQTYDNGELRLVDKLPEGAPPFQADDTLTKQAECTWLFQASHAISRVGEIEKQLNCKDAGAYLVKEALPGKIVRLNFRVNPTEKPSIAETWIKFQNGWKPCAEENTEKGLWIWCRNPPQFKTFKMNGRECTVYPNCTE